MAETAVSFVLERVYQLLTEEGRVLKHVSKDIAVIKYELESIQAFMKDADKRANADEGVKSLVKQLRELSFHIEDVIDEYIMDVAQQHHPHHHHGYIAKQLHYIVGLIKTLRPSHRVASEIQEIKVSIGLISERSKRYNFCSSLEQGSPITTTKDVMVIKGLASLFIEEAEVVGLKNQGINWLVG